MNSTKSQYATASDLPEISRYATEHGRMQQQISIVLDCWQTGVGFHKAMQNLEELHNEITNKKLSATRPSGAFVVK